MATERTLSILKPDATRRNLTGKINTLLEAGGLKIVAQKDPAKRGRNLAQRGDSPGDLKAFVGDGLAQHVDQQIGSHGPFKGVDSARRQTDNVGQPPQQRMPRTGRRGRGTRDRFGYWFAHGSVQI